MRREPEEIGELKEAIRVNARKAGKTDCGSNDALKYTQAALNATNALIDLEQNYYEWAEKSEGCP